MIENDNLPSEKGKIGEINPAEKSLWRGRLPEKSGLSKAMKLRHRTLVNTLFDQGESGYAYPLRMLWRTVGHNELEVAFRDHVPERVGMLQFMITVPKKKRKHAVDRVLMRRRIREAFRLNRHLLDPLLEANPQWRTLSMAFIYISPKNESYAKTARAVEKLLTALIDKYMPREEVAEASEL
jgi:ribonuclease P protein component